MPVNIVDCIGTESSMEFCARICNLLYKKYGITAFIGDTVLDKHLNIRLIHEAEYYKENNLEDPHNQHFDAAVQHITLENFVDNCDQAIAVIVHEVLIKEDLTNGKTNLFDWRSLGFAEDLVFGYDASTKETERYVFMTVHPDGSFEFTEQGLDLFEEHPHDDCAQIFQTAKIKRESIEGIVKDAAGNINTIKKSKMITIPESDKIHHELANHNNKLRNKEMRDELLTACLDIKMFQHDGKDYYFAGYIGLGLKRSLHHAANIREIDRIGTANLLFHRILPLLNIKFVRNGQLTVIPFPFKYIGEYLNSNQYT